MKGSEYREAILVVLAGNDGKVSRQEALTGVINLLETYAEDSLVSLSDRDYECEPSGMIRWEHRADTEIRKMRDDGSLKEVADSGRGYWELTTKGFDEAERLLNAQSPPTTQEQRIAKLEWQVAALEATLAGWRGIQKEVAINLRKAINALESKES